MCIKEERIEEIMESALIKNNKVRDLNLKNHIEPLTTSIDGFIKWRNKILIVFVGNIFAVIGAVYFIGGWMADVTSGIKHNDDRISELHPTGTPSPFVLDTKIEQCKTDQTKTEAQLQLINNKLDRLIERSIKY